jgi:small subunit ribosomal protein S1
MLPKIEFQQDIWPEVYASRQNRSVLTWPVIGVEKHDGTMCLVVGKERVKGIIPLEESGIKESDNERTNTYRLIDLVGQEVSFIVLSTNKTDNIFIASRSKAAEKTTSQGWNNLESGQTRTVIARRIFKRPLPDGTLKDVGVFVELEGIESFLPIGEISYGWVDDIESLIQPGDTFDVKILEVDKDKHKLSISVKALYDNPWPECAERYKKGGIYRGTVSNTVFYGVFVNLEPGVTILCNHPKAGTLNRGDQVTVTLTFISPEEKKAKGIISRVIRRN